MFALNTTNRREVLDTLRRAPPPTSILLPTRTGVPTHRPAPPVTAPRSYAIRIDPFDPKVIDVNLASFDPRLEKGAKVHAGEDASNALVAATKAAGGARARLKGGVKLSLGDAEYVLMGSAGSGAHADVFEAEHAAVAAVSLSGELDDEDDDLRGGIAVKVQTARLARWEWVITKRLAERLAETDIPLIVQPTALHLVGGSDASGATADATTGVIVMPFGAHGTLQDVLNAYLRVGDAMDEVLVMYYAIELLRVMDALHRDGVLHADIKPDNLLVRNGGEEWCDWAAHRPRSWKDKGLALIDFGRALDLNAFPSNAVFFGDHGTEGFRCVEMVNGEAWTFQADAYCVAATIHALLFGKYMKVSKNAATGAYAPTETLRRYWKTELWEAFFHALLNCPTSELRAPPCFKSLRYGFEAHLTETDAGAKIRLTMMKQTIRMADAYDRTRGKGKI